MVLDRPLLDGGDLPEPAFEYDQREREEEFGPESGSTPKGFERRPGTVAPKHVFGDNRIFDLNDYESRGDQFTYPNEQRPAPLKPIMPFPPGINPQDLHEPADLMGRPVTHTWTREKIETAERFWWLIHNTRPDINDTYARSMSYLLADIAEEYPDLALNQLVIEDFTTIAAMSDSDYWVAVALNQINPGDAPTSRDLIAAVTDAYTEAIHAGHQNQRRAANVVVQGGWSAGFNAATRPDRIAQVGPLDDPEAWGFVGGIFLAADDQKIKQAYLNEIGQPAIAIGMSWDQLQKWLKDNSAFANSRSIIGRDTTWRLDDTSMGPVLKVTVKVDRPNEVEPAFLEWEIILDERLEAADNTTAVVEFLLTLDGYRNTILLEPEGGLPGLQSTLGSIWETLGKPFNAKFMDGKSVSDFVGFLTDADPMQWAVGNLNRATTWIGEELSEWVGIRDRQTTGKAADYQITYTDTQERRDNELRDQARRQAAAAAPLLKGRTADRMFIMEYLMDMVPFVPQEMAWEDYYSWATTETERRLEHDIDDPLGEDRYFGVTDFRDYDTATDLLAGTPVGDAMLSAPPEPRRTLSDVRETTQRVTRNQLEELFFDEMQRESTGGIGAWLNNHVWEPGSLALNAYAEFCNTIAMHIIAVPGAAWEVLTGDDADADPFTAFATAYKERTRHERVSDYFGYEGSAAAAVDFIFEVVFDPANLFLMGGRSLSYAFRQAMTTPHHTRQFLINNPGVRKLAKRSLNGRYQDGGVYLAVYGTTHNFSSTGTARLVALANRARKEGHHWTHWYDEYMEIMIEEHVAGFALTPFTGNMLPYKNILGTTTFLRKAMPGTTGIAAKTRETMSSLLTSGTMARQFPVNDDWLTAQINLFLVKYHNQPAKFNEKVLSAVEWWRGVAQIDDSLEKQLIQEAASLVAERDQIRMAIIQAERTIGQTAVGQLETQLAAWRALKQRRVSEVMGDLRGLRSGIGDPDERLVELLAATTARDSTEIRRAWRLRKKGVSDEVDGLRRRIQQYTDEGMSPDEIAETLIEDYPLLDPEVARAAVAGEIPLEPNYVARPSTVPKGEAMEQAQRVQLEDFAKELGDEQAQFDVLAFAQEAEEVIEHSGHLDTLFDSLMPGMDEIVGAMAGEPTGDQIVKSLAREFTDHAKQADQAVGDFRAADEIREGARRSYSDSVRQLNEGRATDAPAAYGMDPAVVELLPLRDDITEAVYRHNPDVLDKSVSEYVLHSRASAEAEIAVGSPRVQMAAARARHMTGDEIAVELSNTAILDALLRLTDIQPGVFDAWTAAIARTLGHADLAQHVINRHALIGVYSKFVQNPELAVQLLARRAQKSLLRLGETHPEIVGHQQDLFSGVFGTVKQMADDIASGNTRLPVMRGTRTRTTLQHDVYPVVAPHGDATPWVIQEAQAIDEVSKAVAHAGDTGVNTAVRSSDDVTQLGREYLGGREGRVRDWLEPTKEQQEAAYAAQERITLDIADTGHTASKAELSGQIDPDLLEEAVDAGTITREEALYVITRYDTWDEVRHGRDAARETAAERAAGASIYRGIRSGDPIAITDDEIATIARQQADDPIVSPEWQWVDEAPDSELTPEQIEFRAEYEERLDEFLGGLNIMSEDEFLRKLIDDAIPDFDVIRVDNPESLFYNPHLHDVPLGADAAAYEEAHQLWLTDLGRRVPHIEQMRGYNSTVFVCSPHPGPCHANVIRDIANGAHPEELGIPLELSGDLIYMLRDYRRWMRTAEQTKQRNLTPPAVRNQRVEIPSNLYDSGGKMGPHLPWDDTVHLPQLEARMDPWELQKLAESGGAPRQPVESFVTPYWRQSPNPQPRSRGQRTWTGGSRAHPPRRFRIEPRNPEITPRGRVQVETGEMLPRGRPPGSRGREQFGLQGELSNESAVLPFDPVPEYHVPTAGVQEPLKIHGSLHPQAYPKRVPREETRTYVSRVTDLDARNPHVEASLVNPERLTVSNRVRQQITDEVPAVHLWPEDVSVLDDLAAIADSDTVLVMAPGSWTDDQYLGQVISQIQGKKGGRHIPDVEEFINKNTRPFSPNVRYVKNSGSFIITGRLTRADVRAIRRTLWADTSERVHIATQHVERLPTTIGDDITDTINVLFEPVTQRGPAFQWESRQSITVAHKELTTQRSILVARANRGNREAIEHLSKVDEELAFLEDKAAEIGLDLVPTSSGSVPGSYERQILEASGQHTIGARPVRPDATAGSLRAKLVAENHQSRVSSTLPKATRDRLLQKQDWSDIKPFDAIETQIYDARQRFGIYGDNETLISVTERDARALIDEGTTAVFNRRRIEGSADEAFGEGRYEFIGRKSKPGSRTPEPDTGRWGNPYPAYAGRTKEMSVIEFADDLAKNPAKVRQVRQELRGKALLCFDSAPDRCHGEVLAFVAEGGEPADFAQMLRTQIREREAKWVADNIDEAPAGAGPTHRWDSDLWKTDGDAKVITTNGYINRDGNAVMGGGGTAAQAKKRYPGIETELGAKIQEGGNQVYLLDLPEETPVVSLPVKGEWWRGPASAEQIEKSLVELVALVDEQGWQRVIMTPPGTGNGMLDNEVVFPLLNKYLDDRFIVVGRRGMQGVKQPYADVPPQYLADEAWTMITGGQTGGDTGWMVGARRAGVRTGGRAPSGYLRRLPEGDASDKAFFDDYGLTEYLPNGRPAKSNPHAYVSRTIQNNEDADLVIIPTPDWGAGGNPRPSLGTFGTAHHAITGDWLPRAGMLRKDANAQRVWMNREFVQTGQRLSEHVFVRTDGYRPIMVIRGWTVTADDMAAMREFLIDGNYRKIHGAGPGADHALPRGAKVLGEEVTEWEKFTEEIAYNLYNGIDEIAPAPAAADIAVPETARFTNLGRQEPKATPDQYGRLSDRYMPGPVTAEPGISSLADDVTHPTLYDSLTGGGDDWAINEPMEEFVQDQIDRAFQLAEAGDGMPSSQIPLGFADDEVLGALRLIEEEALSIARAMPRITSTSERMRLASRIRQLERQHIYYVDEAEKIMGRAMKPIDDLPPNARKFLPEDMGTKPGWDLNDIEDAIAHLQRQRDEMLPLGKEAQKEKRALMAQQKVIRSKTNQNSRTMNRIKEGELDYDKLWEFTLRELHEFGSKQLRLKNKLDVDGNAIIDKLTGLPELDWDPVLLLRQLDRRGAREWSLRGKPHQKVEYEGTRQFEEAFIPEDLDKPLETGVRQSLTDLGITLDKTHRVLPISPIEIIGANTGDRVWQAWRRFISSSDKVGANKFNREINKFGKAAAWQMQSFVSMQLLFNVGSPLVAALDEVVRYGLKTGDLVSSLRSLLFSTPWAGTRLASRDHRIPGLNAFLRRSHIQGEELHPMLAAAHEQLSRDSSVMANPFAGNAQDVFVTTQKESGLNNRQFRQEVRRFLDGNLPEIPNWRVWAQIRARMEDEGITRLIADDLADANMYQVVQHNVDGTVTYLVPSWVTDASSYDRNLWFTGSLEDALSVAEKSRIDPGTVIVINAHEIPVEQLVGKSVFERMERGVFTGPDYVARTRFQYFLDATPSSPPRPLGSDRQLSETLTDMYRMWADTGWSEAGGEARVTLPVFDTAGKIIDTRKAVPSPENLFLAYDGYMKMISREAAPKLASGGRTQDEYLNAIARAWTENRQVPHWVVNATHRVPTRGSESRVLSQGTTAAMWSGLYSNPQTARGGEMLSHFLAEGYALLVERHAGSIIPKDPNLARYIIADALGISDFEAARLYVQGSRRMRNEMRKLGYVWEGDILRGARTYADQQVSDLLYDMVSSSVAGRQAQRLWSPFARAHADFMRWWTRYMTEPSAVGLNPAVRRGLAAAWETAENPVSTIRRLGSRAGRRELGEVTGPGTFTSSRQGIRRANELAESLTTGQVPRTPAEALMPVKTNPFYFNVPINLRATARWSHAIHAADPSIGEDPNVLLSDEEWELRFGEQRTPAEAAQHRAAQQTGFGQTMDRVLFTPLVATNQTHLDWVPTPMWVPQAAYAIFGPDDEDSTDFFESLFPVPFNYMDESASNFEQISRALAPMHGASMGAGIGIILRLLLDSEIGMPEVEGSTKRLWVEILESVFDMGDPPPNFRNAHTTNVFIKMEEMSNDPGMWTASGSETVPGWEQMNAEAMRDALGTSNRAQASRDFRSWLRVIPRPAIAPDDYGWMVTDGAQEVFDYVVSYNDGSGQFQFPTVSGEPDPYAMFTLVDEQEHERFVDIMTRLRDGRYSRDVAREMAARSIETGESLPAAMYDVLTMPRSVTTEQELAWAADVFRTMVIELPGHLQERLLSEHMGFAWLLVPKSVAKVNEAGEFVAPLMYRRYLSADGSLNQAELATMGDREDRIDFYVTGKQEGWLIERNFGDVQADAWQLYQANQADRIRNIYWGALTATWGQPAQETANNKFMVMTAGDPGVPDVVTYNAPFYLFWPDGKRKVMRPKKEHYRRLRRGEQFVMLVHHVVGQHGWIPKNAVGTGTPLMAISPEDLEWLATNIGVDNPFAESANQFGVFTGDDMWAVLSQEVGSKDSSYQVSSNKFWDQVVSTQALSPVQEDATYAAGDLMHSYYTGRPVPRGAEIREQFDALVYGDEDPGGQRGLLEQYGLPQNLSQIRNLPAGEQQRLRTTAESAIQYGYATYEDWNNSIMSDYLGRFDQSPFATPKLEDASSVMEVPAEDVIAMDGGQVMIVTADMYQYMRNSRYLSAGSPEYAIRQIRNLQTPYQENQSLGSGTRDMFGDWGETAFYVDIVGLNAPAKGSLNDVEATGGLQQIIDQAETVYFGVWQPERYGISRTMDPTRDIDGYRMWMWLEFKDREPVLLYDEDSMWKSAVHRVPDYQEITGYYGPRATGPDPRPRR